jgi:hypothetical protein
MGINGWGWDGEGGWYSIKYIKAIKSIKDIMGIKGIKGI